MKIKTEHIHRATEICRAAMCLSCYDLALLENACCEAARFHKDQGKPCTEQYMAMKKRLATLSSTLDESTMLKAQHFASRKSKKLCS